MYVSNIGDSRCISGERRGKRIVAYSLSIDQTPYRKDECERIKNCGGCVMTKMQAEGEKDKKLGWDDIALGSDVDANGDPPRVYEDEKDPVGPACAFTRSIGDRASERIGIVADAEIVKKELSEKDQYLVLASDGVWEFITNQSVIDTVGRFDDPLEAARAIISEAYMLWLQFEVRTDDITIIIIYVDTVEGPAPREASEVEIAQYEAQLAMGGDPSKGTAEGLKLGQKVLGAGGGEMKAVRRGLSAEKKQEMQMTGSKVDEGRDDDLANWVLTDVPKTPEEVERIAIAVKGNFLFQHLNEKQSQQIYSCMQKMEVVIDDMVIKQGETGDWFYIVDSGEYRVTLDAGGKSVEIMRYKPAPPGGANPCFGELAIMYDRPRAASVQAVTSGTLWAIDRKSFKKILMKSSTKALIRTLRSVEILKSLSVGQLQRLSDMLAEDTINPGEYVIRQGEDGDTFYIIKDGTAVVTKTNTDGVEKEVGTVFAGQYFGERALIKHEPRAANIKCADEGPLKLLYISKAAFEEVLGPLQKIIDDDSMWRFKMQLVKQLKKNAAGLVNASLDSFTWEGIVYSSKPVQYALAKVGKKQKPYTVKVVSKNDIVQFGMQTRLRHENRLVTMLHGNKRFLPLALTTLEDDAYLYSVYPTRSAVGMPAVLESSGGSFDEQTAMFYAAAIMLGLDALHQEGAAAGGVCYRHMTPDAFILDNVGYPQMLDLRYASKAEPPPRDLCGFAHYYSPEQIGGQGHGVATDFWMLGCLVYEMVLASSPWITGDPTKDSEVAIFARISAHKSGDLPFPSDANLTFELQDLLNELMEPDPEKRLGMRKDGIKEIRQHAFFSDMLWGELAKGSHPSPHKSLCEKFINKIVKDAASKPPSHYELFGDVFTGDQEEFEGAVRGFNDRSSVAAYTKPESSVASGFQKVMANKSRKKQLEDAKRKKEAAKSGKPLTPKITERTPVRRMGGDGNEGNGKEEPVAVETEEEAEARRERLRALMGVRSTGLNVNGYDGLTTTPEKKTPAPAPAPAATANDFFGSIAARFSSATPADANVSA